MIHDISVTVAIFAAGILAGYVLKVVMVNMDNNEIGTRGGSLQ